MSLDWKSRHCENDYTIQHNLQVQCNTYQITNGMLHRIRTENFTISMEMQKTMNSQNNLKKKGAGEINLPDFTLFYTTKLQSSNNIVLAQKQKYRLMEQNRKSRDKPNI